MPPGRSVAVGCGQSRSVAVSRGQLWSVAISRGLVVVSRLSRSHTGKYVLLTAYASCTLQSPCYSLYFVGCEKILPNFHAFFVMWYRCTSELLGYDHYVEYAFKFK